jgi:U5 snRNP spliceosome subunit
MYRRLLAAAFAAAAILGVSACSGDGESTAHAPATRGPATSAGASSTPSASPEASVTAGAADSSGPATTRPAGGGSTGGPPVVQPPPPGTPASPTAPPLSSPTAPTSPPPPGSGNQEACSYALVAALRWLSFEASLWLIEQVPEDPAPRQSLRERALAAADLADEGRRLATHPLLISALDRIASGYRAIADVALTGTVDQIAFAIASPQLEAAMYDIDAVCQ